MAGCGWKVGSPSFRDGRDYGETAETQAFADSFEEIGDGAFRVRQCVDQSEDALQRPGFAGADACASIKQPPARADDAAKAGRCSTRPVRAQRRWSETDHGLQEQDALDSEFSAAQNVRQPLAAPTRGAAQDGAEEPAQ